MVLLVFSLDIRIVSLVDLLVVQLEVQLMIQVVVFLSGFVSGICNGLASASLFMLYRNQNMTYLKAKLTQ